MTRGIYALLVAASAEVSDGRAARAVPLLERALLLDPTDARLYRQLARVRGRLGDLAAARPILERAVELAPDDEKIRGELITLLRETRDQPALERVVAAGLVASPDSASLATRRAAPAETPNAAALPWSSPRSRSVRSTLKGLLTSRVPGVALRMRSVSPARALSTAMFSPLSLTATGASTGGPFSKVIRLMRAPG